LTRGPGGPLGIGIVGIVTVLNTFMMSSAWKRGPVIIAM
jgi:hypothetical protein